MGNLKMLGMLAVSAAALMSFAGTASATVLTSPEGTTYTGNIVVSSTTSEFNGPYKPVYCFDSVGQGSIEGHGAGKNVTGNLSSLTFKECNYTVTVKSAGSLRIDSGNNVISTGAEISIATSIGTCVLTTNGTFLGVLTEGVAKIDFSAVVPRTGGSFLCGSTGTWTGYYDFTTPTVLFVD